jgi:hypothetical protein
LEPWKNPELGGDQGNIFPMIQEDPIPRGGGDQFAPLIPPLDLFNRQLTHAAQQRFDFERALSTEQTLTVNEQLSEATKRDAFTIALGRAKAIAATLDLDAEPVEMGLRVWLFTVSIPDVPELPDPRWREAHARNPEWKDLAWIGVRYARMGVSEVDVERLIGEQHQIQGPHGVNLGTEMLRALSCSAVGRSLNSAQQPVHIRLNREIAKFMTNSRRQRGKSRNGAEMSLNMTIENPTIPMRSLNNLPLESPKVIHLQTTLLLSEIYADMQNQETHG